MERESRKAEPAREKERQPQAAELPTIEKVQTVNSCACLLRAGELLAGKTALRGWCRNATTWKELSFKGRSV